MNIPEPDDLFIKQLSNFEFWLLRKDGKVVPVEESIVYFYDKEGIVSGAVGVIRDITERNDRAPEQYRRSRNSGIVKTRLRS